jgi:hypothetical protein
MQYFERKIKIQYWEFSHPFCKTNAWSARDGWPTNLFKNHHFFVWCWKDCLNSLYYLPLLSIPCKMFCKDSPWHQIEHWRAFRHNSIVFYSKTIWSWIYLFEGMDSLLGYFAFDVLLMDLNCIDIHVDKWHNLMKSLFKWSLNCSLVVLFSNLPTSEERLVAECLCWLVEGLIYRHLFPWIFIVTCPCKATYAFLHSGNLLDSPTCKQTLTSWIEYRPTNHRRMLNVFVTQQ